MELRSIANNRLKLVRVLINYINVLCRKLDRPRSKRQFQNSLRTMQLFENILYKIQSSKIVLSHDEYIAWLTLVYKEMKKIFRNKKINES